MVGQKCFKQKFNGIIGGCFMNLVIYNKKNRDAICAYDNCYSIPQRHNTIVIGEELYEVVADPCFSFEKNTVWIFVQKCK